ncbi:hypothetical protein LCGC14_0268380 [marine sediment metagenome]|uniref:Uncharacterized protein n=1 Tax=marine sediment metagenome TaxID=412755 RepID=A0A0F9U4C0_9ZZZZ
MVARMVSHPQAKTFPTFYVKVNVSDTIGIGSERRKPGPTETSDAFGHDRAVADV